MKTLKHFFEILKDPRTDVNAQDGIGKTILMHVCRPNPELLPELLKHNELNVNIQDDRGKTAFIRKSM